MYYYRDKDAKEIDIVLEHDGVLNPIEISNKLIPESKIPIPITIFIKFFFKTIIASPITIKRKAPI